MARQAKITAITQLGEGEQYVVKVHLDSSYPDALDQGRATAAALMHDMLTDAVAQAKALDE